MWTRELLQAAAISTLSGQGGWPLTGFLLPDGRPFFGGTYFPPEDAMGRPGFRRILEAVAAGYRDRRGASGKRPRLASRRSRGENGNVRGAGAQNSIRAWRRIRPNPSLGLFDPQQRRILDWSPKFPHPAALDLLLECQPGGAQRADAGGGRVHDRRKWDPGGVYDQIAGGFHRYSVDERWCVPHFEKMSYDNSELLKNFLHGYQVAREPFFRETAEGIVDWTNSVLSRIRRAADSMAEPWMRTRHSTTTATISRGRRTKFAPCSRLKSRASWSFAMTSNRTARCITTRRKTFCGSRARSPK